MKYITVFDIGDRLLKITDTDIEAAEGYMEDVAQRKGVSVEEIKTPLPYKAKRLLFCYACYNNCLCNVGKDPTSTFDGGRREDIYAQKLELYKNELKEIEETINAYDFRGVKAGGLSLGLERA